MHYSRWLKHGTTDGSGMTAGGWPVVTDEEYFWQRVDRRKPDECWRWTGPVQSYGYGDMQRRGRSAHRFSYELHVGPIPDGLLVLHSCDNPACVNPAHLRAGTQAENMRDKAERCMVIKGEDNHFAKLTNDQAREVYIRRHAGENLRVLAAEFGVSHHTVWLIEKGRRYAVATRDLVTG